MSGPIAAEQEPGAISTARKADAGTPAPIAQFTAVMPK